MNKLTSRISFLFVLLALALPGCGDDDGTVLPDAGPIERDASNVDTDAGDTTPPTVIATTPSDGSSLVATDTAIRVAFSEPMDVTAGTIAAATDEGAIELGDATWSDDRTRVEVAPVEPLPAGVTITVTVGSTFRDASGNSLAPSYTFEFTTDDAVAPTIVRTTPAEGATGVDTALATIEVEVSEPVRVASARARLEGPGAPVLGDATWTDRVARWTVSGLLAESSYELVLEGFADVAGNALDASALGTDGRLDFTTGADVTAPVVVESTPREAQLDVDVGLVSTVAITFSEPMDTSSGTFALVVGGATTELAPEWDRGGRRVRLEVAGLLQSAAAHHITLTGLTDLAGNALDAATYLVDSALDFTTGSDLFVPFVAFTSPEEGATATDATLEIVVVFSEAMDPSTGSAPLEGDGRTVTVGGTWSSGNTVLTFSAPMLQAGRSYALDLRGFRDAGGTSVDATHAYLGNGIAEFTFRAPNGERCGDALTEAQAATSAPGRVEWVVASGAVTSGDGSASCDPDGHGPDVLVRYRKTTAAARDGGTALRVFVDGAGTASSNRFDVEIAANDCRTGAAEVEASRLRCLVERNDWEQWLDVGPGDYFVWVSRDGSSTFNGATIVVEEVPGVREGESCEAPLTTSSPSPIYTAPTMPGHPHRWELPGGFPRALDRGITHADPDATFSCMPEGASVGHDAVVTYDKLTATSLVTVRVTMASASARHGAFEIVRGACDPGDAARTELACLPFSASAVNTEVTLDGPAGPISTWYAERRSSPLPAGSWASASSGTPPVPAILPATIEITEFEPQQGDTCANAIPLTAGITNVVSANRPWRAHVPACLATGGVTWFRFTPTQGLAVVRTNGSTSGAVVDAPSGQVLRCSAQDDTSVGTPGLPVFGEVGRDVCVALSSSAGVTQITVEEIPYDGVRGLETAYPLETPSGVSVSGSSWMSVLDDDVFRGATLGRIHRVSTSGGLVSETTLTGATSDGGGAVARPEGLYIVTTSVDATSPRVLRVTDGTGAFLATPQPLDVLPEGFSYPPRAFDAITWDGTQFIVATTQRTSTQNPMFSEGCCDPTIFYAIPAGGGAPVEIGRNATIVDINGIAADATHLYVHGRVAGGWIPPVPPSSTGTSVWHESIFRLRRDQLSEATQTPVALWTGSLSDDSGDISVDSTTNAGIVYFRTSNDGANGSNVMVVVDPDAETPRWVGPLWRAPGSAQNGGLAYDPRGPSLWLNDTNPNPDRWVRLD
ncbi:Ig-like domain-containing protein [Sandaracinus amylolyticus]|uniref:Ig-like domain-containing protein n=1 Tax=Sandaracinus amylolyticus TaxID=927083 RepID=UPI001F418994|nr:Ig-like domain-containing protein [Sandaracinus amylolyticus]UJR78395.1 Hypothetical protein I5071_4220 [Sandaracinus amylolyticus]